jgi:SAM-dependent methyltransferase
MPSSNLTIAPTVLAMLAEVAPRRVLDVGPGHGKYGVLCREYLPTLERLDAIELEGRYVDRFPWLTAIYDRVAVGDICTAAAFEPEWLAGFDVVLMVDVLEHLTEGAATELLRRIPGRIVIATPRDFFQNPEAGEGWESERHRSLWTSTSIAEAAGRPLEVDDVWAWGIGGVVVRVGPK